MLHSDNLSDHSVINSTINSTNMSAACTEDKPIIWDTYLTYRVTVEVFIVSILCLFGFIGNTLSVVILCQDKDRRGATNWLLLSLSVVDSIYLFTCLFIQTFNCIEQNTNWIPWLSEVFPYLMPYMWAIGSIAQTATVWMVLLVTTDRYIAICKPLNTQLRSTNRAMVGMALVALLAIVYNIPRFFERKIIYTFDPCTNKTIVKSEKTVLRNNDTYFLVYKTICFYIFRSIGPLLLLIFFNLQLISALRLVHRKQKEMTNRKRLRSENITTMLVAVVTVFIICEIPDSILRILFLIHRSLNVIDLEVLRYINVSTNLLLTINSSINFIIYCLIGKKFRKILHNLCSLSTSTTTLNEISETEPLTMKTTANRNGVGTNSQSQYKEVAL